MTLRAWLLEKITGIRIEYETVQWAGSPTREGTQAVVKEFLDKGYTQVKPRCMCCSLAFERRVNLRKKKPAENSC